MERAASAWIVVLLLVASSGADEPKAPVGGFLRSPLTQRLDDTDFATPGVLAQVQPDKDKKDKKDKKETPPPEDLAAAPPTPTEAPAGINPT